MTPSAGPAGKGPSGPRCVLIYNPRAGRWRASGRIDRVAEILRRCGYHARPVPTSAPGDATSIAREQAAGGVEVVFVLGGDGTLREAAAGLLGTETALAPLPGGTVNLIPYAFGLSGPVHQVAARFADATTRRIDVGLCGDRPFLMMASAGLDAHVLAHVRSATKRRLGRLAVAAAAIGRARRYTYPEIQLQIGERRLDGSFFSVSNLPFYGGPLRIAPEARVDDRSFDLVVLASRGPWATLGFAIDLARSRHTARRDVSVQPVRVLRWLGSAEAPIQLDGDAMPDLVPPLDIAVAPERLLLLAPRRGQRV